MLRARLAVVASLLFVGMPAFALNNRSAVSINGSDANPCTAASPCRSFGAAAAVTNPGGEIIALDSGGYGPFTVSQAMTISGAPGVHAAITATAVGITVTPPGPFDTVFLRNLVILAGSGGSVGIGVGSNGSVHIVDCFIRGFANTGILVNGAETVIDHVIVQGNLVGISVQSGSSVFQARITNSQVDDNSVAGIDAGDYSRLVVVNTSIARNDIGVRALTTSSALTADVTLEHCAISGNRIGIYASNPDVNLNTAFRLANNVISYNISVGILMSAATVFTYGNNAISANSIDVLGGTLTPLQLK